METGHSWQLLWKAGLASLRSSGEDASVHLDLFIFSSWPLLLKFVCLHLFFLLSSNVTFHVDLSLLHLNSYCFYFIWFSKLPRQTYYGAGGFRKKEDIKNGIRLNKNPKMPPSSEATSSRELGRGVGCRAGKLVSGGLWIPDLFPLVF